MVETIVGPEVMPGEGGGGASAVAAGWPSASGPGKDTPLYVQLLGLRLSNPLRIIQRVEEGLSFHALERFQKNTRISTHDLAELIDIKLRTLRRRKEEGRLAADESDRLLRASRVFAKALELFEGDTDGARRWFYTPAKALGGEPPIALARTDLGAREVVALIDRLEQGVLS
jgi:putative toxin-antitoxin system antitoxin component (TIGR02293 family)